MELDKRTLCLRDLRMIGCTAWAEPAFSDLIGCIERDEIRPVVARSFPMREIVAAQHECLRRSPVGNLVLIPLSSCPALASGDGDAVWSLGAMR